ncbi:MAG: zinc-ribbon domain-containing protein [Eubacterium sp.]|nr:zinc-ribbon domain-containing protein [Eubacterium sp.]
MPFCVNCGREYQAGMKFCNECGVMLPPAEPESLPAQPAQPPQFIQAVSPAPPIPAYPQPQPQTAVTPRNPTFYLDQKWAAQRRQVPVGWIVLTLLWLVLGFIFYNKADDAPLRDRDGYIAAAWASFGFGALHSVGIVEFYRNKSVYDSIRIEILSGGIRLYCVEKKLLSRISSYTIDWRNINQVLIGKTGLFEIHFYDNFCCVNRIIQNIPIEKPLECIDIIREKAGIKNTQ